MKQLYFIILVLILFSCKKEESTEDINYGYIEKELKTNYSFGINSYWVFQNQNLELDCVIVSSVDSGYTSACPKTNCTREEYLKTNYKSFFHNKTYNHYILSNFMRYNGGGNWGEQGQPIFIFNKEDGYYFNGLTAGQKNDSLNIKSKEYYHVQSMQIDAEKQYETQFDFDQEFVFSPKVGIIKSVSKDTINGDQTWELLRFKIEK